MSEPTGNAETLGSETSTGMPLGVGLIGLPFLADVLLQRREILYRPVGHRRSACFGGLERILDDGIEY